MVDRFLYFFVASFAGLRLLHLDSVFDSVSFSLLLVAEPRLELRIGGSDRTLETPLRLFSAGFEPGTFLSGDEASEYEAVFLHTIRPLVGRPLTKSGSCKKVHFKQ